MLARMDAYWRAAIIWRSQIFLYDNPLRPRLPARRGGVRVTAATYCDTEGSRFRPLMAGGRDYSFPCDAPGHVDMDSLSERTRLNYLYAHAVRDLELERPDVQP